jgi:hypothetical protein
MINACIVGRTSWIKVASGLALALVLGACGAQERTPPAAAPEPPPPAERARDADKDIAPPSPAPAAAPSTLEEESAKPERNQDDGHFAQPPDDLATAQASLDRARAELDAALAPRKAKPAATAGAPAASRGAADEAGPAPKAEKKTAEPGCATACRAFSSLGRAASAVCRLAGEKDTRCSQAHGVVADAEKRVSACGCRSE